MLDSAFFIKVVFELLWGARRGRGSRVNDYKGNRKSRCSAWNIIRYYVKIVTLTMTAQVNTSGWVDTHIDRLIFIRAG